MAYETKTKITQVPVSEFISNIEDETKRDEARRLVELFEAATKLPAHMFGPTIIAFGTYHYKYASGHEGDAPLAAFAPRKANLVFYFSSEFEGREQLLEKLGKHKVTKGCVYVKRLSDIDESVLSQMIVASAEHTRKMYP